MKKFYSGGYLITLIFFILLAGQAEAEETLLFQDGILVLPLQADQILLTDQVYLGLAIQNVLENMLALHSHLEEHWVNWYLMQLFPQEEEFHAWLRDGKELPAAIKQMNLRYLVMGRVSFKDDSVLAALELHDQRDEKKFTKELVLDLPELKEFRMGFLDLLEQAGISAPEAQKDKMLWKEDLPLEAFILVGQGLFKDFSTSHYHQDNPAYDPKPFEEGLRQAPRSYLLLNNLGWLYQRQKNYLEAQKLFAQALAVNPFGVDAADGMITIGNETGDEKLEETWTVKKSEIRGKDPKIALISMWNRRGDVASEKEDFEKAVTSYEQALILQRELKDRRGEKETLNKLGVTYYSLGQYDKAISYYEQALAINRELEDSAGEGDILNYLGTAYYALDQYDQAIPYYEQALSIWRELKDRYGEELTLNNLGTSYSALGEYDQALSYYEQVLTVRRELKDREGEASTLNDLGNVYYALSQYDQAIPFYEQSLAIYRELKDRIDEGTVLNNLGQAYEFLNQYDKAIAHYEQVLAIRRELKDREGEEITLNVLGNAYNTLNQYVRAISYYEQALPIVQELKARAREGIILYHLGNAYDALGQYSRAINYYQQVLEVRRELGDLEGEGDTLNRLGKAYNSLGQYDQAIKYYKQAVTIQHELKDLESEGNTLHNLGQTYAFLSQYSQAIEQYEHALILQLEIGNREEEGMVLHSLMLAWKGLGKPRVAIFYGKLAVHRYQDIQKITQRLEEESQKSKNTSLIASTSTKEATYRGLIDLLISEGRLSEAQQILALLKKKEYFDFTYQDVEEMGSLSIPNNLMKMEETWERRYREIAHRVMALGTEQRTLMAQQTRTSDMENQLLELERDMQEAKFSLQKFFKELSSELADSKETMEKVQKSSLVEISSLLQKNLYGLDSSLVALYTLVGEEKYQVILVTPEIYRVREYPIKATDLSHKVRVFRQILQNPHFNPLPMAQELYQILVGPVAQDLKEAQLRIHGQAPLLMWSLDGVLRYLPVGALYDGEKYLIERYRLGVFTLAGRDFLWDKPGSAWKVAGLGTSKFQGEFPPLPGTSEELQGIIHIVSGILALDENFTKTTLQTAFLQQYPGIHIASHFKLRPGNKKESFIVLGDGSQFDLSQINPYDFEGVKLLVFSAGDTDTKGNGKEIESFAMLVQESGARSIVLSLWPVAERSTSFLMREFYRLHEQQMEMSKLEALRQGQLTLLYQGKEMLETRDRQNTVRPPSEDKKKFNSNQPLLELDLKTSYAHPYYWAPFILIGNWR